MAEVLFGEGSVLGQGYVAAAESAGKLRTEQRLAAEDLLVAGAGCALEDEGHAERRSLAAEVDVVVMDTGAVYLDAGSHCMLVETAESAVADTVALAD